MVNITRTEQKIQTKQKIFDAAVTLINENGYRNVSIKDIVNKAAVSTGTFYVHFKSKQDIVSQSYYENLNQFMRKNTPPTTDSAIDQLLTLLDLEFQFAESTGVELTTLAFITNLDTNLSQPGSHFSKRTFTANIRLQIQRAVIDGIIKLPSENLFFLQLESLVRGVMVSWCFANGTFGITDTGHEMALRLINTYRV